MDELMKKFKEMEVKLLGQSGNNNDRRNYQRNYINLVKRLIITGYINMQMVHTG